MFQITEFTEARLASVTNRIEKHGEADVPAVSLSIEVTTGNTLLDCIDPSLRHALYKAVDQQDSLPDVEPSTPVLGTSSIEAVKLTVSHEGWTLLVDNGIDETEPLTLGGCKVDKLVIDAKQGGSITLKFRVGTSDIDADRLGTLGMHIGQSIWVKVLKPQKKADAIDGSTEAFKKDHPDATDLFSGAGETEGDPDKTEDPENGTDDTEGGTPDAGQGNEAASGFAPDDEGAWPFQKPAKNGSTSDFERTLDHEREQREIEAGMVASIQAAGVAPKGRRGRKAVGAVE